MRFCPEMDLPLKRISLQKRILRSPFFVCGTKVSGTGFRLVLVSGTGFRPSKISVSQLTISLVPAMMLLSLLIIKGL